jgi:drug/metabolite transporter (DMT)-like permease
VVKFGLLFAAMAAGMPAGLSALALQSQAVFSVVFAVAPFAMLAPVFAVASGALMLRQPVHPTDVVGGLGVLAGIALGLTRPRAPVPVPSTVAETAVPAGRS